MFRKVLVANRGEIAVRIIRTLREMGIASVAVYSDVDRTSLHVRLADEAARIGPAPSTESYLRIDRILEAARRHGAEAIHPGYGFLSENAGFAAACAEEGIVFIGPPPEAIRLMGSKTAARRVALSAGVAVVPGVERVAGAAMALAAAADCGYPVMLKAVAGGGGKGMRLIARPEEMAPAFRDASSEAERAFGNPELYIEKVIERPRHVEIQLMGDCEGNLIHLGERECSMQRRHQKVMEECPSPLAADHPEMRARMGEAALRVARAAGYHNAGTVEFLVDEARTFYFLEMNTRLQVEHPVTEMVTGLDLVRMQVEMAAGKRLRLRQEQVEFRGASLECRIYAEDPFNNFFPSPGKLTRLTRPLGPGVRIDGCVYEGWTVPVEYDPLLAKLAVHAASRPEAVARMARALREYDVAGIKTNVPFFRAILGDECFRRGELHTGFIAEFMERQARRAPEPELETVAALVAALEVSRRAAAPPAARASSAWVDAGRGDLLR